MKSIERPGLLLQPYALRFALSNNKAGLIFYDIKIIDSGKTTFYKKMILREKEELKGK